MGRACRLRGVSGAARRGEAKSTTCAEVWASWGAASSAPTDVAGDWEWLRGLPFDSAPPNLRVNRAAARFTSSARTCVGGGNGHGMPCLYVRRLAAWRCFRRSPDDERRSVPRRSAPGPTVLTHHCRGVRQPQRGNRLPVARRTGNPPLPRSQFPRRCVHASACGP
jgi:hypothetical protein